jgi:hypothetical protein
LVKDSDNFSTSNQKFHPEKESPKRLGREIRVFPGEASDALLASLINLQLV